MVKYPIKFKAAILEQNRKPLVIDEVTFNGPLGIGQVLVRIHYSGICGKQVEEMNGSGRPDKFLPHMLGHEGSGEVIDVGPGVTKVIPEDIVVLHWLKGSGIEAATPIYSRNGKKVNAGWVTTFNEYGVISENRLTRIPKESDLSIACLLGCAVTTGVGVVLNEANLRPGESVAIFGCGGVGLSAIQAAVLVHACPIIAVDKNPESLSMAKKMGASHVLSSDADDFISKMNEITSGNGAKNIIIAVGNPKLIEMAVRSSSVPGFVYFVGVPPFESKISVDAFNIHLKRSLLGSCGGGCNPDIDIPTYLALHEKGSLKLKTLISNEVTLGQINDGMNFLTTGRNIGRCIVKIIED